MIRTVPPGAKVYVRERFVGMTPVRYEARRSDFSTHMPYRIELDGCQPQSGELDTRVVPGRVVAGVLTSGISLIFAPPVTYTRTQDFVLQRTDGRAGVPPGGEDAFAQHLRRIDDLHAAGVLPDDEWRKARQSILGAPANVAIQPSPGR